MSDTVEKIVLTKELLTANIKEDPAWASRAVIRAYDAWQAGKLPNLDLKATSTDEKFDPKKRFEYAYAWIKQNRNLSKRDSEIIEAILTQQCVIDYLFNLIVKNPNGPKPETE